MVAGENGNHYSDLPHERQELPQVTEQTIYELQVQSFWKRLSQYNIKRKINNKARQVNSRNWKLVNEYIYRLAQIVPNRYATSWDWLHFFIFPQLRIQGFRYNDQFLFWPWLKRKWILTKEDRDETFSEINQIANKNIYNVFQNSLAASHFLNWDKSFLLSLASVFIKFQLYEDIELFFLHDGKRCNFSGLVKLLGKDKSLGNVNLWQCRLDDWEYKKGLEEKLKCSNNKIDILQSTFNCYLTNKADGTPYTEEEVAEIIYPTSLKTCFIHTSYVFNEQEKHELSKAVQCFENFVPKEKRENVIRNLWEFFFLQTAILPIIRMPPSKAEFSALFYCYRQIPTALSKILFLDFQPPLSPTMFRIRKVFAQYVLRSSRKSWEKVAQGSSHDEIKSELYAQLSIADEYTPIIPFGEDFQSQGFSIFDMMSHQLLPSILAIPRLIEQARQEKYSTLRNILRTVCDNDKQECISLLYVISRIILGKAFYRFITKEEKNLTVIVCQNPFFMEQFLRQIFISELISEHSFYYLSDSKHASCLMKEAVNGFIANITTENRNKSKPLNDNLGYLMKLFRGKKIVIKDSLGLVPYYHSVPCIYLTTKDDLPERLDHDTIHLSGNTATLSAEVFQRTPLSQIEIITLCIAAIRYIFDTSIGKEAQSSPFNEEKLPSLKEALKIFIDTFCEKAPCLENGSEKETEQYLQSPDCFYEIKEDVRLMLEDWYTASYGSKLATNARSLKDPFATLYSPKLYKKKDHVIRQYGKQKGKDTDTLVLYGIKVNYEKFERTLQELQQDKLAVDIEQKRAEFDAFFDKLIENGRECIFAATE